MHELDKKVIKDGKQIYQTGKIESVVITSCKGGRANMVSLRNLKITPYHPIICFNNTDEWWLSIPEEMRPKKDQPFYHLLAESNDVTYEAYVSEQNLLLDKSKEPVKHPLIEEIFSGKKGSNYFKLSN